MKILFVNHNENTLFAFRKEFLDKLIRLNYEIVLCITNTKRIKSEYGSKVSKIIDVKMDLKSKSIFSNIKVKHQYKKIINEEKPDVILSFGVKPNLYCGELSRDIPIIANITGLGNIFSKGKLLKFIGLHMYKKSFKNVDYVFFQNRATLDFFKEHKIPINNYKLIPGSGVNTERFNDREKSLPNTKDTQFLYASRAIKEKGIDVLLDAIPKVIEQNENVHFNFISSEESIFDNKKANEVFSQYKDYITVYNRILEMPEMYRKNHFIVSPSFYKEGISNVLLESLSCERPIITTNDNPGCMDVLQEGFNGYGVKSKDVDSLVKALIKAANTPRKKILQMGIAGRAFVKENFNRDTVIKTYVETILEVTK